MKLLQKKINELGYVIEPNILKVDSFLNHQIDVELFDLMAKDIYEKFKDKKINKIVTIESSGIAMAVMVARYFNNADVVFARKETSKIIDQLSYVSCVHSFTKDKDYLIRINKNYLNGESHILIVDDFLANGQAVLGLIEIVNQANATIEGIAIAIEKAFQPGRENIKEKGYDVYSLARIKAFKGNKVIFEEDS